MISDSLYELLDRIRVVEDERDLHCVFDSIKPGSPGKPARVAFINAHGFNLCWKDPSFLKHVLECDYIFRDGAGMKILYWMLGRNPGLNMNGTDLIPRIMDLYKGHDVALMGTESPYLEAASIKIAERGLFPVAVVDGFQEENSYVETLRAVPAPLVILAMGMPKQEYVAAMQAREMHFSTLIVCGGAILDFIGGKVARAPEIVRKAGMEWLYRLIQEPRRLFRRYVIGNFIFLGRAWRISRKRQDKTSLKILHVVRQYAPSIGGLESYVENLAAQQISAGHQCDVLTLNKVFHGGNAELTAFENINDIFVYRAKFFGKRRFFIPFVNPFFFRKYDIVHVHNTDFFYDYAGLCSFMCGVPSFATTHGGFFHTQDFSVIKKLYFNIITRFSSLFYKKIFAISHNDEDIFKKISRNVVYLPNAIKPLGADIHQGNDFLYIGRLAQNKDVHQLINVFSRLKKEHKIPGRLHIVGPEWDITLDSLEKAAEYFDIREAVVFHGASESERIQEIAKDCGYFVSASLYEGFGMSMLEAMSVGLIPLVHDNEAFRQLTRESGIGIVTDYNKPEIAAAVIATYMQEVTYSDRVRARDFSAAFSWPELSAKVLKFYTET